MLLTFSPISSYNSRVRTSWDAGIFIAAVVLVVALALTAAGSAAFLLGRPGMAETLTDLPTNPWWLIYHDPGSGTSAQPLLVMGASVVAVAIGLGFAFRTRGLYRRSRTPVLPYLLLFFLTLGTECLRAPSAMLYAADSSIPFAVILTRTVYWGRFVGLLALLLSSLYCMDLKYRRFYMLGGGVLLVALAMAATIPIDRSTFLSQFLWKLGDEEGVWFVDLSISALTLLTTIGAAVLKRDRRFFMVAGGFLLLLAAREVLFFGVRMLPLACGLGMLAVGAVFCLRSVAGIYSKA